MLRRVRFRGDQQDRPAVHLDEIPAAARAQCPGGVPSERYAVRRVTPVIFKGGLPGNRLKRVLDDLADSLEENISLSQLAAIACMSPHYFSELFQQSTGRAPHNYLLLQRIERAQQRLRDPRRSVIDAGLDAGFQNPSHFARVFRKLEGTTPSKFRAEYLPRANH